MELRPKYYILDENKSVVPCWDLITWAKWFEKSQEIRKVKRTQLGSFVISTVFLSIDHSFDNARPLLFETMVFNPEGQGIDQERCSTWARAEMQHDEMVSKYSVEAQN